MTDNINASFRDSLLDKCREVFVEAGFQSPRKWTINLKITDDFLGWVGLNSGLYPDHVFISPFIGIHVVPIEKMLDASQGNKYRRGALATISTHLGLIAPNEKVFHINTQNKDAQVARLVDLVSRRAVPWMHEHASFEALLPNLAEKIEWRNGNPEKYAIALAALGRLDEMRCFVDDVEQNLPTKVAPFEISHDLKKRLAYYMD